MPVYQELLECAVGIAGAGQNFDGNGRYLRSTPAGGSTAVQTGALGSAGTAVRQRGAPAARHPPRVAGQGAAGEEQRSRAYQNAAPDLNRVTTGTGP